MMEYIRPKIVLKGISLLEFGGMGGVVWDEQREDDYGLDVITMKKFNSNIN